MLYIFLSDLGNITKRKSFSISFLDYLIFPSICFIISSFTFNHVENVVCHSALLFKTEAVFPQRWVLVAHSRIPPLEFPWPKEGTKSYMIPFVYNNTHFILFFKLKYLIGDGQGGQACCNSWGRKESDTTERLNWTELIVDLQCNHWFVSCEPVCFAYTLICIIL